MARQKFDLSLIPPAPTLEFEEQLWGLGIDLVAGIDEAGRGPLAGPVFAAVVILPSELSSLGEDLCNVRDSKELTPIQRERCAVQIRKVAQYWGVGSASAEEIDQIGISPATKKAVHRAVDRLPFAPGHLLVDYIKLEAVPIPQTSLIKGDARSLSIAAASILAKTERDRVMTLLDGKYPGYGFAQNKGYGTASHRSAIASLGPSLVHRKTFAPMNLGAG